MASGRCCSTDECLECSDMGPVWQEHCPCVPAGSCSIFLVMWNTAWATPGLLHSTPARAGSSASLRGGELQGEGSCAPWRLLGQARDFHSLRKTCRGPSVTQPCTRCNSFPSNLNNEFTLCMNTEVMQCSAPVVLFLILLVFWDRLECRC